MMRNRKKGKESSNALALMGRLAGRDPEMLDLVEQEEANLDIARKIFELRSKAGLSRIRTRQKGWHHPIGDFAAGRCGL